MRKVKGHNPTNTYCVGTDDIFTPPGNSLLMAEKINGSWLVQIKEGGHGLMLQYPETFRSILRGISLVSILIHKLSPHKMAIYRLE